MLIRHRRNVGRALSGALLPALTDIGYYNVFAGITLPNAASIALHEAFGFIPIGVYRAVGFKIGAWHDVGWWQRELRAPVGVPQPLNLLR